MANDRIKQLKEKQQKELERAIKEERIKNNIPLSHLAFIYCHKDHISIKYEFDVVDVACDVLSSFNLIDVSYTKGTFTSIKASKLVSNEDELKEICDIVPVYIKADANSFSRELSLNFFTEIKGEVASVKIMLPYQRLRALLNIRFKRVDYSGGYRYENISAKVGNAAYNLEREDGQVCASPASPIKWARGGNEYINDFTLYWDKVGLDPDSWAKTFCKMLERVDQTNIK